jgi:hypothetical protein
MNDFNMSRKDTLYFAAIGDVHDRFFKMEAHLSGWERKHGRPLDFVLQVGDLQPCRDLADLDTVAMPQKYRTLHDFQHIWRGGTGLPRPTYFIGGNHEPYGWLDRHPQGAEIAPNLHYLGRAGAVTVAGLKVVGLTGIHSELRADAERPPVEEILHRSRKLYTFYNAADMERAVGFGPVDVLLLHEWPQGVLGGQPAEKWDRWLRGTITPEDFGSEEGRLLIDLLKPQYVFCGHMHHPWEAEIKRSSGETTRVICLADVPDSDQYARFFYVKNGEICEI